MTWLWFGMTPIAKTEHTHFKEVMKMTNYGILTNEDYEVQTMLDKAQKRKRVRLADLDDVKEAAKELLSILSGFINPAVYKGLKVTVYMGEAIDQLKYVKYVSPEHVGMIEQPTTAFTLLFNGDETFTVTEVKRKGHPGQRFCIAACPEGVMMIILQQYLQSGLDNWAMKMRAMAEQKEMEEIYDFAYQAYNVADW